MYYIFCKVNLSRPNRLNIIVNVVTSLRTHILWCDFVHFILVYSLYAVVYQCKKCS